MHASPGALGYRSAQATVLGVPLEPGERVVWIRTHSHTAEKVRLVFAGLLFLVLLIGILLLLRASKLDSILPKAHVLTTRRLLVIRGGGTPPESTWLSDVVDVEPVRMSVRGGGVAGAVVGALVSGVANHLAAKNPKLDPAYWARAAHVVLALRSGERVQVPAELNYTEPLWCTELGPLLARALWVRDVEQWPSVAHPA